MVNLRGLPPAADWLPREVRDLKKKIRLLEGASPIAFDSRYADTNTATLSYNFQDLAVCSMTVPDGFSRAMVQIHVNIGASRTTNVGPDWLNGYAWIDGAPAASSAYLATSCPEGGGVTMTMSWAQVLTDLEDGQTITAGGSAAVGPATPPPIDGWIDGSGNGHSIMYATFLR